MKRTPQVGTLLPALSDWRGIVRRSDSSKNSESPRLSSAVSDCCREDPTLRPIDLRIVGKGLPTYNATILKSDITRQESPPHVDDSPESNDGEAAC
jgi:hypothetical protein